MTGFDVVVVGGGASGCVVAARLAEDPGRRVLLLEAGPAPRSIAEMPSRLLDAARVPGADPSGADNRWYPAALTSDRPYAVSRGRVLGGSTATNGGYFMRPRRADFDRWSAHGDDAWSWSAVLPPLRELERDLDFGGSELHGDHGPVPVRRTSLEHPAASMFVEAALASGFVEEPDKNGEQPPGVGPVPANVADGVRWNAALAYLLFGPRRSNLAVHGSTTVLRVVFEADRVRGIEVLIDGRAKTIAADSVVLSAGALASPALLMRSGIGPADDLRAAGVTPLVDAPGVGAAFSDHPQVILEWQPSTVLPRPTGGWMGGALNTDRVEVLQSLITAGELTGAKPVPDAPLPLLVAVSTPEPHGRLAITDPDPRTPASIDFNYLRTSADRRSLREAVRTTANLLTSSPFTSASTREPAIDRAVLRSDRALDEWVAAHLGTSLHTCGTIPFRLLDGSPGPVDQFGAVRGVRGLRVADTSILPTVPMRGPAVAAMLVGENIASAIRRGC